MSLADHIIEEHELIHGLGPGHTRLTADLNSAQRFQLSDEFAAAADQIMQSPTETLIKSFQLSRLPFKSCWIETRFAARQAFTNGRDLGEMYRRDISTVGILIKAEDDQGLRWRCHLGWRFSTGECSLSVLGQIFDMREFPERYQILSRSNYENGKRTPAEVDSLMDIESRATPFLSDYHLEFYSLAGRRHSDALTEMTKLGLGDWMGEMIFWVTAVALMNSRNVTVIEPGPDLSKIAKARRKRGRHEPLSYTVCKIAPRILTKYAASPDSQPGNLRAHFVIGHFKRRRSGIHWWSPHVRGTAQIGEVSKTYLVT